MICRCIPIKDKIFQDQKALKKKDAIKSEETKCKEYMDSK